MKLKQIQNWLGVDETGKIDFFTQAALKNFQLTMNMKPTGEFDDTTIRKLAGRMNIKLDKADIFSPINEQAKELKYLVEDIPATTDLSEIHHIVKPNIDKYFLPESEYVKTEGIKMPKEYIFIHHTAGWNNPYNTINDWANDNRGRIATHFVIGGKNIKNGDETFDGKIVQCMPMDYWAFHLGNVDSYMHRHSIGIEICNFGQLTLKNGKFITWAGQIVPEDEVLDLEFKWRGYRYWHKYTDKQLESLKKLIEWLSQEYNINIDIGLKEYLNSNPTNDYTFNYHNEAMVGDVKGLLTHSNVNLGKCDCPPQLNLINMIKNLKNGAK